MPQFRKELTDWLRPKLGGSVSQADGDGRAL